MWASLDLRIETLTRGARIALVRSRSVSAISLPMGISSFLTDEESLLPSSSMERGGGEVFA